MSLLDSFERIVDQAMNAPFCGIADGAHWDATNVRARGLSLAAALEQAVAKDNLALFMIKATEGGDAPECGKPYVDPECWNWADACDSEGVAKGFFAVITNSTTGTNQAQFLHKTLRQAGLDPATILCALDRETGNPPCTPQHAEEWVTTWRALTGRWPLYYRSQSSFAGDYANPASPSLIKCPDWRACYGEPPSHPCFLLQYMGANSSAGEWPRDVASYPHEFSGLGKFDRSAFAGTREELLAQLATVGA